MPLILVPICPLYWSLCASYSGPYSPPYTGHAWVTACLHGFQRPHYWGNIAAYAARLFPCTVAKKLKNVAIFAQQISTKTIELHMLSTCFDHKPYQSRKNRTSRFGTFLQLCNFCPELHLSSLQCFVFHPNAPLACFASIDSIAIAVQYNSHWSSAEEMCICAK